MKYTIQKMSQVIKYQDDNKIWVILNGYAFLDEDGGCFIITYGEGRRDSISNYLSEPIR